MDLNGLLESLGENKEALLKKATQCQSASELPRLTLSL